MEINSLQSEISSDTALKILKKKEPSLKIQSLELVYYPYFRVIASVKTKLLARKVDGNISCIVDLVNGTEALTGDINKKSQITVDRNNVLQISIDMDDARTKALGFIRHAVLQKMKVLKVPKIALESEDFFYKPYWIINCIGKQKDAFYLLMDSISGSFHLLQP